MEPIKPEPIASRQNEGSTKTTADEGVALSLGQFAGAWRIMCAAGPAPIDEPQQEVHYLFSGTPIPFFNIALLTGAGISGDELAALGQRAIARIAESGLPWFLVVTHERLAPAVDPAVALEALGLVPLMPLTGMRADTVAALSAAPAGVELAAADEDEACAAVLDVNSLAYGMDLETAKPALGRRAFWQGHHAVLGRADGRPATSAAVLDVDGQRYVAFVATVPECQRRGFAEAAMRHALDLAAAAVGERPTVLHATAAGRPIYERMGYQTIANHTLFIEQRFLEGH